jgi:hypothetical protein
MRIAAATVLVSGVLVAVACGSGSEGSAGTGAPAPEGGADVSAGGLDAGAGEAAQADAPSESGDYGPYPAAHYPMPQMRNLGGPVLATPRIVTVTFAGDAKRDDERAFDDGLPSTSWWAAVTRGWGIGTPAPGKHAELPDTVSGKTLDDRKDLQPMIAGWIASGALPAPDAGTVYVLFFPASTTITEPFGTSCAQDKGFYGYHDALSLALADGGATLLPDGGGTNVAYAVIASCGVPFAPVVSHEIIEALTDPHPSGTRTWSGYADAWWGPGLWEVADVCNLRPPVMWGNNQLSRAWVNAAAAASEDGCQPADPGQVYYGTAVPTDVIQGLPDPGGGASYDCDGYLVVPRGQTRTVDAVFFSTAPLPNDAQIAVGKPQYSPDPTQMPPVAPGVKATVSPATAHNGTHVTLTLQIAADAPAGDWPLAVRSILGPTDFHNWPAILRVK